MCPAARQPGGTAGKQASQVRDGPEGGGRREERKEWGSSEGQGRNAVEYHRIVGVFFLSLSLQTEGMGAVPLPAP